MKFPIKNPKNVEHSFSHSISLGKIYSHQSMFWSDLGPRITFEAIGIIDSTLPTVAIYAKSIEESSEEASDEKDVNNLR